MSTTSAAVPEITLVTSTACHLCDDAHATLQALVAEHRIRLHVVDIRSAEGSILVAAHRPAMNPVILIDGQFFSAGRLSRGKLNRRLTQAASTTPAGPP